MTQLSFVGTLTTDPRSTATSGEPVVRFGVSTRRLDSGDAGGSYAVIALGRTGEIAHKYLKAGDRVYVEGHSERTARVNRHADVVVDRLVMLGKDSAEPDIRSRPISAIA